MARQVFQLKIVLTGVEPPVWRRLLVPGGYTLDRLHRVLQYAMGWQGYHLHSFEVDGVQYGVPDPGGELQLRDELDTRLDAVAAKGGRLQYLYDFGDWWEHEIEVEDVLPAEADERYPICLAGERACPPEEVGGEYGYAEFVAATADPEHPNHAELSEWYGRPYDPTVFDPARVTTLLRHLT